MQTGAKLLALTVVLAAATAALGQVPSRRLASVPTVAERAMPGEAIVKFRQGVGGAGARQMAAAQGLRVARRFRVLSDRSGREYALLRAPGGGDARLLAQALARLPQVESATPNWRVQLDATHPNDFRYSALWAMHNTGQTGGVADADIDAPEAWDLATGSSGAIVVVIDTGVDYRHPDLTPNLWSNAVERNGTPGVDDDGNGYVDDVLGIDAANGDSDVMDGHGHGTHVAGTIGAVGNNALGVVGTNWSVRIMALKMFADSGADGTFEDAIECIEYAVEQKVVFGQNVVAINASWGGDRGW